MAASSSKSRQSKNVDCDRLPDMSSLDSSIPEEVQTLEPASMEMRQDTKTILEDVCADFETMDVLSSKTNKAGLRNLRNNRSPQLRSTRASAMRKDASVNKMVAPKEDSSVNKTVAPKEDASVNKKVAPKEDVLVNKTVVPKEDASVNQIVATREATLMNETVALKEDAVNKNLTFSERDVDLNAIQANEVILQPGHVAVVSDAELTAATAVVTANSAVCIPSEMLPLNDCETVLSEDLCVDKNIPSLAQLADAEIVQSGDNVSIIVTNTRLIKVLTNADNAIAPMQAATVINPAAAILEAGTQQLNIVDPNVLTDDMFQTMEIVDDSVVAHEMIISEKEASSHSGKSRSRAAERGTKRSFYTPSVPTSKARRVTARMKAEWTKQLEANGRLSCKMPGCDQTYITVANFQTHFKYCTGGSNRFQYCLYCDSVIFSTHKAIMQHMEVEHPDKVEEYKAAYPEEMDYEEASNELVSEDNNVAMNLEEVTQPLKKKRKLSSSKENVVLPKKAILKHKLQSIQNSMAENAKEFKKCVRFDNIVDKINSVDPIHFEAVPSVTIPPKPKEKKKRIYIDESYIAEKKYFEDDDDDVGSPRDPEIANDPDENPHTKARMILYKERYKRYKEHLKLTRDWSCERKTYSRKRDSDTSLDSSLILQLQNESLEDVHQLNDTAESSSISLNVSETEIDTLEMPSLEILKVIETDQSNVVSERLVGSTVKMEDFPPILSREIPLEEPVAPVVGTSSNFLLSSRARKERTCYGRASLEAAKAKSPVKYQGIITYGVRVPEEMPKPIEQPVTFDSLVDSYKQKPTEQVEAAANGVAQEAASTNAETILKIKEEKQPSDKIEPPGTPKRRRGRPPKPKPEPNLSPADSKKANKKNAKKYSTAMLKSIEKNVKNRKIKLFGVKKNSKFKSAQLQSQKSKAQKKMKTRRNFMAKKIINKKRAAKGKTVDESAIQCQENIDNHLPIGVEPVAHVPLIVADHNYTQGEILEDGHLIIDTSNIAEEVVVTTSNVEQSAALEKDSSLEASLVQMASPEVQKSMPVGEPDTHLEEIHDKPVNKLPVELKNDSELVQENNTDGNIQDVQKDQEPASMETENVISEASVDQAVAPPTLLDDKQTKNNAPEQPEQQMECETPGVFNNELPQSNTEQIQPHDASVTVEGSSSVVVGDSVPPQDAKPDSVPEKAQVEESFAASQETVVESQETLTASQETLTASREETLTASREETLTANREETLTASREETLTASREETLTASREETLTASREETLTASREETLTASREETLTASREETLTASREETLPASQETLPASQETLTASQETLTASQKTLTASQEETPTASQVETPTASQVETPTASQVETRTASQEETPTASQETVASSQETATPEAPVKRRRGRPKKNAKAKPLLEVSSLASPVENTSKNEQEKSNVDSFMDSQTDGESVADRSSVAEEAMQTPVIRKSERVKKRRQASEELMHSTPKETPPQSTPEVTTPAARKSRGRPRRQPKELAADISQDTIEESVEKQPEVDAESTTENLRKYSRKGRPRKCVRYADLNSGVESSESMDGLNTSGGGSGKDKVESAKASEKKPEDGMEEDLEEKPHDSSYGGQEGKIILPLKKRKQRQARKDDSAVENAGDNKRHTDSEILLPEEENENEKDGDDVKSTTRNLRNRRGTKRKRAESSDEDWELPTKSDKQTSRGSARRKSSNRDVQEMEEDSSNSSDTEKTTDHSAAVNKKGSKRMSDASLIRRFAAKSRDQDMEALKYSLETTKTVFPDHKPQRCFWRLLTGEDYYAALPSLKTSAYFKIENALDEKEAYWNSLSFFDSAPLDKGSCHSTFFTGGPVLCSAWCPTPVGDARVQYVAMATSYSMNKLRSYICTEGERGLLQLWNVGVLNDKTLESKPFMEMSISHMDGPITDMAWCPYGCWEDPAVECLEGLMPRLGMLALACADGKVRIYSIPHPQFLPKEGTGFPIYKACPSIVLDPMCGGLCAVTRKAMCTSISWQKSDCCERLAAGYGNGLICIWRINTSATILAVKENKQTIVSPYLVFNAHGTPVMSVSFSPLSGARYLVSSSLDKSLKFWDLIDSSLPFFTVKKGYGKSAEWARHYCGAFASLEYGMNCFKGSTFFKECGSENYTIRVLSNSCCAVMKSTMSEWLNALAIADMSGAVSVSFVYGLLNEHTKSPQYYQRSVYMSELKLVEGIAEKVAFSSYTESRDCIHSILDITEVTSVMNQLVETCCEAETLDSAKQLTTVVVQRSVEHPAVEKEAISEKVTSVDCVTTVEEIADIVSVVDEVAENCEEVVCLNGEEVPGDKSEETIEETCKDEATGEECGVPENIPEKVAEIADIVAIVTDMNDVAGTVDQLTEDVQTLHTVEDSLMEVDDGEMPVMHVEEPLEAPAVNLKANPVNSDVDSQVAEVLCNLLNLVEEKENTTDVDKISNEVAQVKPQNSDEEDKFESNACISTVEGITDIISAVEDVVEKCIETEHSGANLNSFNEESARSPSDIKSGSDLKIASVIAIEGSFSHSESVECVLQKIKEVICTVHDISIGSCNLTVMDVNVPINGESGKIEKLDSLAAFLNKQRHCRSEAVKQCLVHETGLPCDGSNITDVVDTVMDVKDTTEAVSDMGDVIASIHSSKDVVASVTRLKDVVTCVSSGNDVVTCVASANDVVTSVGSATDVVTCLGSATDVVTCVGSATDVVTCVGSATDVVTCLGSATDVVTCVTSANNVVTSVASITGVVETVEDLVDVNAVMEELKDRVQENSVANSNSSLLISGSGENISHSEVSAVLNDIIQNISQEIETEEEIKGVLNGIISSVEMVNRSRNWENQDTSSVLLPPSDIPNELTAAAAASFAEVSAEGENTPKHTSNVPPKFDYGLPEMDETMMSADDESSNSENDVYSDEDFEMADAYSYEQDSFSDASVLSECSLDSDASLLSSLGESDVSEASTDSAPGDQEDVLPNSDLQDGTADVKNASPVSPTSFLGTITNTSHELPSTEDGIGASSSEDRKGGCDVSTVSTVENVQESSEIPDKIQEEDKCLTSDSPVPDSCESKTTPSENSNLNFTADEPMEIDRIDSSSEVLQTQCSEVSNELGSQQEPVSPGGILESVPQADTSDGVQCCVPSDDAVTVSNSCDTNSVGTAVNSTSFSNNETCTESIDKNSTVCTDDSQLVINLEDSSSSCNKSVGVVSDSPEILEERTVICEEDTVNKVSEESNSLTEKEPVTNNDRNSLPKSLSSYEDVISQYGIVFKDMNTANFESIEDRISDVSETTPLDQYHITSVKTVAWNPNFGSHFWLFSAGQSGIARLSYISDIHRPAVSRRQDAHDA